ncbi:MAG: recombinase family protein, partial [Dehalococcoidales bacterium]|nr:recombinase family protein [Dehalococcoidales bacterium]
LDLMALFEAAGVKFVSLRDNIDTSGPVGRFILHILGAIAELERGITAERVAEDMKLRAKRGKWNGGLAPYGRRMEDGQLKVVAEEAAVLHQMRKLLLELRSWRGVAIALNRAGLRTRGWEPLERDGRVIRKGHAPEEWTPTSVKRVLLQPINAGTLVYNRRTVKGKTSVPRPAEEHVVVESFCDPIFSREEMDELLRVAAEIEGTPPRRTSSQHLLSGLVECTCGTKMYGVNGYVNSKSGRYCVRYYRCRRASHKGTCSAKQIPAAVIEPVVVEELRKLGLDRERLRMLAGEAQETFQAGLRPLLERREGIVREVERVRSRIESLLELAEDRLISKQEFAARRACLESERADLEAQLATIEAEMMARAASAIDIEGTVRGLRHLGDVFDELEDTSDRRRLLASCLDRVVVRRGALDLHVLAHPLILSSVEPKSALNPLGKDDFTATEEALPGGTGGGSRFESSRGSVRVLGVGKCTGVRAGTSATLPRNALAPTRWSVATRSASRDPCSTALIFTSRCRR